MQLKVTTLKVTTWNINSVRLRINLVAKFIKAARPDVLCLQETKCPDDAFPLKRFKRLGYEHIFVSSTQLLRQGRLPAHVRSDGRARRAARSRYAAQFLRAGRRRRAGP
jgi:hypothetical protein